MGELVRVIADLLANAPPEDEFVFRLPGSAEMRDRIALHLDRALFDSVVTAEVRALASTSSFERFFDAFSQLVIQLIEYRWLALGTSNYFAFHANRGHAEGGEAEARAAIAPAADARTVRILDDDPVCASTTERTVSQAIILGGAHLGTLCFGVPAGPSHVDSVAPVLSRELGAVIRLVLLLEEAQRLATTDPLTSLYNRRAFVGAATREIAYSDRYQTPLSLLLIDIDHFKSINDSHGHGMGDTVLATIGRELHRWCRTTDLVGRWGGEEFVVALPNTDIVGAQVMAERVRESVAKLPISDARGELTPLTVSIGVAQYRPGQALDALVDRADRGMYEAKAAGRNRVCCAPDEVPAATRGPVDLSEALQVA